MGRARKSYNLRNDIVYVSNENKLCLGFLVLLKKAVSERRTVLVCVHGSGHCEVPGGYARVCTKEINEA